MRKLGEFTEEYILEKAKEEYKDGRADWGIDARKTALIVVDMLNEFVKRGWTPYWIPEATRQIPKIKELIESCREVGVPIIYTAYKFHPLGIDAPKTLSMLPIGKSIGAFPELFLKESICQEIAPKPDDKVIVKYAYSGFYSTELDMVLKNLDVDTVIICGTMTNYCCGATAREAYWHGYKVVFGSDINSTDDPELHEAELKTLRRGYALVASCTEIIKALKKK